MPYINKQGEYYSDQSQARSHIKYVNGAILLLWEGHAVQYAVLNSTYAYTNPKEMG
jgi:hypothetical protein